MSVPVKYVGALEILGKKTETKTKTEKSMSSHYITFNITPIYVIKPELH